MIYRAKEQIEALIERTLSEKRKRHTYGVVLEAIALARRYGENVEKAELAALGHDLFRGRSTAELDRYIIENRLDRVWLGNANLSHGKVAADYIERTFGVRDPDVLAAVAYHTTGRAGMSRLEKIIYLADAIEPGRVYPGVAGLRRLAYQDLDQACAKTMDQSIDLIRSRGLPLHHDTQRARDEWMEKGRTEYDSTKNGRAKRSNHE